MSLRFPQIMQVPKVSVTCLQCVSRCFPGVLNVCARCVQCIFKVSWRCTEGVVKVLYHFLYVSYKYMYLAIDTLGILPHSSADTCTAQVLDADNLAPHIL